MRVAMIGTKGMNVGPDAFGGFETVVTELAPRLVSAGHEVTVFGRRKLYSADAIPEEVRGVRLRNVWSFETKNLGTMTNSLLSIWCAVREPVDLVILFNLGAGLFLPLIKALGIATAVHLDG